MATYEETIKTLEEMRSRFDSGFSSSDRVKIENLYLQICGKRVRRTGCGDCYRDAFIEIRAKLKTLGTMPKNPNYTLKAGAIVHPQGTSKFYSLNNIPDDVAEEWLGKFPEEISKFETFPTDWQSRVQARKEGKVAEPTKDELKDEVERLNKLIEEKDVEIEKLNAEIEQVKSAGDDGAAAMEIETLKADLEEAKANVEKGKKEAQEEVAELNKSIAELKVKLADANAAVEAKDNAIKKLEEELEAAKKPAEAENPEQPKDEKKADKKAEEKK